MQRSLLYCLYSLLPLKPVFSEVYLKNLYDWVGKYNVLQIIWLWLTDLPVTSWKWRQKLAHMPSSGSTSPNPLSCLLHHTQEPNSLLNGRPQKLRCTAVSPSSQTSGPLASCSLSLSPKAECPIQVSDRVNTSTQIYTYLVWRKGVVHQQSAVINDQSDQPAVCQQTLSWCAC